MDLDLDLDDLADIQAALTRSSFSVFCETALAPLGQKPAAHHRLLIRKLSDVAAGKIKRLMVLMPPGTAKSTYVSQLFAAWWMVRFPRAYVVAASHTDDLAKRNSFKAQSAIRDMSALLGCSFDRQGVEGWSLTNHSEYKPAGMDGPITGRRGSLGLIDDPVKNSVDVKTVEARDKKWDWYLQTFRGRLTPNAPVVLVMTRWNEDDLGGRLLKYQGDLWEVILLPAQALENDPLGRAPGEYLWSDDSYNYAEELRRIKSEFEASGAMRVWESQFQQNPRPLEGSLFKMAALPARLATAPDKGVMCRAWDLASTAQSGRNDPDWTAGVKLSRESNGSYAVIDVVRVRGTPDEIENLIVETAKRDGPRVRIGLPQDPGQAGKMQVQYLTRALSGYRVESSPETGDKETRAGPVAAQFNVGNVSVCDGDWTSAFLDEIAGFPNGAKDDQVDALSRAFSMVGLVRGPIKISPEAMRLFGAR